MSFTSHGAVYPFRAEDTGLWTWALAEPLAWQVVDASGRVTGRIVVPAAFLTDLGTIPWWARFLFSPADPQCAQAYVLHDWCLHEFGPVRLLESAGIMYQALRSLGVPRWRRVVQVLAVIIGIDNW